MRADTLPADHRPITVPARPRPRPAPAAALRVLFLVSAHNGLSQRVQIVLEQLGHHVTVAVVDAAAEMEAAVAEHDPELIVCPFLKKLIPESIWAQRRCLIVHPGPCGDRGPSSLDWAIELGASEWGVTVLEANGVADAGRVLATRTFPVRAGAGKSSLYRHEVRHAAAEAVVEAIAKTTTGAGGARHLCSGLGRSGAVTGQVRPLMTQAVRAIDWAADPTDAVLRKIRAAEGQPGVLDTIGGIAFHLFGAHRERTLRGRPGEIVARRDGAICRATVDGAVWITHLKRADTPGPWFFKLPAVQALVQAGVHAAAPDVPVSAHAALPADHTYREIATEDHSGVCYLRFEFYNGAMSTDQCRRLREAFVHARSRPHIRVIVLMGGTDYFSNGIHLNVIEAADDPAAESWRNLQAMNDLVREIVETESHLVISALRGDAGAGGVPLALAADHVVARRDAVLNPYYQHMGGLYGSEYWTYLLPRRVGPSTAARLTGAPFTPVGTREAVEIGLIDDAFGSELGEFERQVGVLADGIARDSDLERRLDDKRRRRANDEWVKPLHAYGREELARSHQCFFGPDRRYHEARRQFVYKLGAPCSVTVPAPRITTN